eukprot:269677-Chlamydomonas_euryale.AAC.2
MQFPPSPRPPFRPHIQGTRTTRTCAQDPRPRPAAPADSAHRTVPPPLPGWRGVPARAPPAGRPAGFATSAPRPKAGRRRGTLPQRRRRPRPPLRPNRAPSRAEPASMTGEQRVWGQCVCVGRQGGRGSEHGSRVRCFARSSSQL